MELIVNLTSAQATILLYSARLHTRPSESDELYVDSTACLKKLIVNLAFEKCAIGCFVVPAYMRLGRTC